jgi:hypothetical protein
MAAIRMTFSVQRPRRRATDPRRQSHRRFERKRCAEIARTITQQEAKVVIKSARLEYWEDFGCHVQAGERYRINFKDAIARKIMHSPAELSPPSDTNPTEGR